MAEKTSVVTPERFASGLTYGEYLKQIKVNLERFQHFYDQCQVCLLYTSPSPRD